MRRLIKKAMHPPNVGQEVEIDRDIRYENRKAGDVRGLLRTGPVTIADGEVNFQIGGEHSDFIDEVYEENSAFANYEPEFAYAYWMSDFLGCRSVFFDESENFMKYKDYIKTYDPTCAVYLIQDNKNNFLRIA